MQQKGAIKKGGEEELGLEENKLRELARPLIEYLKENCHPYTSIVITEERMAVVETVLSIPGHCDN